MTQAVGQIRWTIHDIAALPQNEGVHHEIIDGELYVIRSPHHKHQQVAGRIFAVLDSWSLDSGLGEPSIMPGVIFSDANNVIPDVIWVSHDRAAQIQDEAGHFHGAPELMVEVLSPGKLNEERDRSAKLKLYSVQGVQEYWIVDRIAQRVEVYCRRQAQLVLSATFLVGDRMTSSLLPGFSCEVARLFA